MLLDGDLQPVAPPCSAQPASRIGPRLLEFLVTVWVARGLELRAQTRTVSAGYQESEVAAKFEFALPISWSLIAAEARPPCGEPGTVLPRCPAGVQFHLRPPHQDRHSPSSPRRNWALPPRSTRASSFSLPLLRGLGETIKEGYLIPLGMSVNALAKALRINPTRLN
jgi:hypothetical protein